ncbi:alpha/beta hydrolase [Flagellimonas allohymeniacidonis]|uniref:Alpha/beta hydrolase n=1 Tax=Flagellimonas allohymeniacidonis TaxID=2517819 RepID=A0A4Q8QHR1_9FLAO|nr:alpha/beta hydrolase [Allomuricauda hymeniacidonis]TAI48193.1 alpha/beta hydrolase [Allomuricauda hymeniacidonis]
MSTIVSAIISLTLQGQKLSQKQKIAAMEKVTFQRENLKLVGNLYFPKNFNPEEKYPAVIVGGSLTSVKEQMAATYAAKMALKGIVALAFDYSHYGESEGLPRQFEDPQNKLRDMKAAVSFLESLPYVEGIGALGICTSGGNVAYLAENDSRVKAIATVAAWLPNEATLPLLYGGEDNLEELRETGKKAKEVYLEMGDNQMVLAYSNTDKTASHFGPMEYYMDNNRGGGISAWKNSFSLMSWEPWLGFDPTSKAKNIKAPTMIIHSDGSALPDNAKQFYADLGGEKELVWLEGYHFDFYDQEKKVNEAANNAGRFFKAHIN